MKKWLEKDCGGRWGSEKKLSMEGGGVRKNERQRLKKKKPYFMISILLPCLINKEWSLILSDIFRDSEF